LILGLKLFGVFVKGHSSNPWGHALIKHVNDDTGVATYYDVNVELDAKGNEIKDAEGHNKYKCQKYTQEQFDNKYGSATTKKEAEVSDITNEKTVLDDLEKNTGNSYPYKLQKNNCVRYANNALVKGGHTVQSDGSYGENAWKYPSDWVDGIEKQPKKGYSGGSH